MNESISNPEMLGAILNTRRRAAKIRIDAITGKANPSTSRAIEAGRARQVEVLFEHLNVLGLEMVVRSKEITS